MTFIALPHDFDPKTGQCLGFQITHTEDGSFMPVGFLRGGHDLPVDLEKLSQNLASMLNGHELLHRIGKTHQMYFERHAEGINFRFRHPSEGGTSEVGAMFTVLPGIEMEFEHETSV